MIRITEMVRGYKSSADRKRAIILMWRAGTAQRFICFRDVQSDFALMYCSLPRPLESRYNYSPCIVW